MRRLQVRVPATVANLGPGFDSLALSLQLYNLLTVESAEGGLRVEITGEGRELLPADGSNLVAQALLRTYRERNQQPPGLVLRCHNQIPLGSGLGSSAAAVVAGLLAADRLLAAEQSPEGQPADAGGTAGPDQAGQPAQRRVGGLLGLATELEGHPDNAAAALLGGLVIVGPGAERPLYRRVEPAVTQVAVVVPNLTRPTREMRQVLPRRVPLQDAAFNIGRTALTVEALRSGDFDLLSEAMEDRLHQPHRQPHLPGYTEAVAAARRAGAAAVSLAGAGPGLVAFSAGGLEAVAGAMAAAFGEHGLSAREYVLAVDRAGAQVALG